MPEYVSHYPRVPDARREAGGVPLEQKTEHFFD